MLIYCTTQSPLECFFRFRLPYLICFSQSSSALSLLLGSSFLSSLVACQVVNISCVCVEIDRSPFVLTKVHGERCCPKVQSEGMTEVAWWRCWLKVQSEGMTEGAWWRCMVKVRGEGVTEGAWWRCWLKVLPDLEMGDLCESNLVSGRVLRDENNVLKTKGNANRENWVGVNRIKKRRW